MTICAALVAVGSLTARLPEIVAKGESALTPVQLWQLAQACSNTLRPSTSATAPPSFGDAGAGGAIDAGPDEAIAGILKLAANGDREATCRKPAKREEQHRWPTKIVKAKIVVLGLDSAATSR
jgi:hypothetical protein